MRLCTRGNSPRGRGRRGRGLLWRKLVADTRALATQAVAMVVLTGLGVLLYVGLYQAYQNLTVVYGRIYASTNFADASVQMRAAPASLVETVRSLPRVREARGRLVKDGTILQPGRERERVLGRFIAVPAGQRPPINDVLILEGRYLAGADEAVLEQQFARDNDYRLGERLRCSYQGSEREFLLVGLASSPEYLYPVASRYESFVAPGTFGVLFIEEKRARQWFGVGPQITEIHTLTEPGYAEQVRDQLEGLASRYGVEYAYTQAEQPSKHLLDLDQQGFAQMSLFFPILFLSAAGLSLYGALNRIVRLQVSVIGTLRACGFSRRQLLWHYMLQGGLLATAGAVPGLVVGHLLAMGMNAMYAEFLRLPMGSAAIHWDTMLSGLLLAAGTGLGAAYLPARLAAGLPPALAMRGEVDRGAGVRRQQALVQGTRFVRVLWRIPLRGVARRASRTIFAVGGIAGGTCIMLTTLGMWTATMDAIGEYLYETRRYELDVQVMSPEGVAVVEAVAALPGARGVARNVSVPVRVRSAHGETEVILTGLQRGQNLMRVATAGGGHLAAAPGEIWLPRRMARRLRVEPGDPLQVEWVKSGRRQRLATTLRLGGLTEVSMGATAYGDYWEVRRALADAAWPEAGYGAFLDCVPEAVTAFQRRLERDPQVMLVMTTRDIRQQIEQQMGVTIVFISVLLSLGGVMAGAAIHSVASVSLLERTRELASLRSLGFSARLTGALAGVELLFLAALGLVVGCPLGAWLHRAFMASYETETISFSAELPAWTFLVSIAAVLALVGVSTLLGTRRLRSLDLAQATKARE